MPSAAGTAIDDGDWRRLTAAGIDSVA